MQSRKIYQAIYEAARRKDEGALTAALAEGPIDVLQKINGVVLSPVSQLAYENRKSAVEFLLAHGARQSEAVRGYARSGNIEKVYALLEANNVSPNIEAMVIDAVAGFAMSGYGAEVKRLFANYNLSAAVIAAAVRNYAAGGHTIAMRNLLKEQADNPDIAYLVTDAIWGCAISGNEGAVDRLLKKYAELLEQYPASKDVEVAGYAFGDHKDLVEKSLVARQYGLGGLHARRAAIVGYARRGDASEVDKLLAMNRRDTIPDRVLVSIAVRGYGICGCLPETMQLLKEHKHSQHFNSILTHAVRGFATGGHVAQVELLKDKDAVNPEDILMGYLAGYHVDQVIAFEPFTSINALREYASHLKTQNGSHRVGHIIQCADSIYYEVANFLRKADDAKVVIAKLEKIMRRNQAWIDRDKDIADIIRRIHLALAEIGLVVTSAAKKPMLSQPGSPAHFTAPKPRPATDDGRPLSKKLFYQT